MTRILVCGGRDYGIAGACTTVAGWIHAIGKADRERDTLWSTLTARHIAAPISVIIHGAAAGADRHAGRWAAKHGIQTMPFPANWKNYGPGAGPIRNQRMIDEGRPDLVVAFPGGRGTADMVRRARAAGIEVLEVGGREARDG